MECNIPYTETAKHYFFIFTRTREKVRFYTRRLNGKWIEKCIVLCDISIYVFKKKKLFSKNNINSKRVGGHEKDTAADQKWPLKVHHFQHFQTLNLSFSVCLCASDHSSIMFATRYIIWFFNKNIAPALKRTS